MQKATVVVVLTASLLVGGSPARLERLQQREWLPRPDDQALQVYAEAIARIEQEALFSGGANDRGSIVAESLKAYLAEKDPFSDFLTPEEYAKFKQIGDRSYAGIGLEIERQRDGDTICYPFPKGPADLAGIKPGEGLVAIDGIPTRGKSLPALAALATGRVGTRVAVEIVSREGVHRQLTITRSSIDAKSLSEHSYESARTIRLLTFTPNTKQELDYLISNWSKTNPIIIDLRGCGGGDFHAAIDAAMLFVKRGEPIVSISGRGGTRSYASTIGREPPGQRVFLWQDESTASAAEVFIAALTENGRATSIGRTSAGKGTRQDIIELSGGAALILTTGYLLTPRGVKFDGHGLRPTYHISREGTNAMAYLKIVNALTGVAEPSN